VHIRVIKAKGQTKKRISFLTNFVRKTAENNWKLLRSLFEWFEICYFCPKPCFMRAPNYWYVDGDKKQSVSGARIDWEDHRYFVLAYNGQFFRGELLDDSSEDRTLTIKLNHRVFICRKEGSLDELIAAMGLDKPKVRKLKILEAPMPGRILRIAVRVGDELTFGDEILSLEAMKMENILKAEGVGTVKAVLVNAEDVVEKGSVLIEFE
jgi:acetyl/propionyl-CoA carboxylase alpha subunit